MNFLNVLYAFNRALYAILLSGYIIEVAAINAAKFFYLSALYGA